jgi:hypothetical protein
MLIIGIHGASIPVRRLDPVETILLGGQPNRLSEEQVPTRWLRESTLLRSSTLKPPPH